MKKSTIFLAVYILCNCFNTVFCQSLLHDACGGLKAVTGTGSQVSVPRAPVPYTNSNGKYYGNSNFTFIPDATISAPEVLAAIDYTENIVNQMLESSSNTIPIQDSVKFGKLGLTILGLTTTAPAITPYSSTDPLFKPNTLYVSALLNKLLKRDINGTAHTEADITITNQYNFYYGTDGNTPRGKYDFVTTLLHEACHSLGFDGYPSNSTNSYGYNSNNTLWVSALDRYITNSTGTLLTSLATPSTAVSNYFLSNDLYFNGPITVSLNGGAKQKMLSSSRSHTVGGLMNSDLNDGIAIHDLGVVGKGILKDIGWDFTIVTGTGGDRLYIAPCTNGLQNNDPSCTHYATVLNQGGSYGYLSVYEDNIPYGGFMGDRYWKIELFTNTGTMYTLYSSTFPTSPFTQITVPTIPIVSNTTWKRNEDGTIKAKITVFGTDNQNSSKSSSIIVGINNKPDKPALKLNAVSCVANPFSATATLAFYAPGATSYTLNYGTASGNYSNTVTIPAGVNTYALTGLRPGTTYYARIKGVNGYSISDTSNEVKIITNYCLARTAQPKEETKTNNGDIKTYAFIDNKVLHVNNIVEAEKHLLTIVNTLGQIVKSIELQENQQNAELDVSAFENGLYIVNISTSKEIIYNTKIIVNN